MCDLHNKVPAIKEIALVGGRLCLDFINTANWIDNEPVDDRLGDYSQVLAWGCRVGLIHLDKARIPACQAPDPGMERLRQFRRHLRQLFVSEQGPEPATLALFNQRLSKTGELAMTSARNRLCFDYRDHDLSWLESPVAYSAAELLISPLKKRVKQCPGTRCGWLFLDNSPNNRRRWCSMATCGNKHKARQFYGRKKAK
ncbi:MAG: hypothetical protein GY737_26235 [Desulfobacteraceae bacterium]|nr:hypothetical protein [Desulfobacteraceae bacterium]